MVRRTWRGAATVLAIFAAACSGEGGSGPVPVAKVEVSAAAPTLHVGDMVLLTTSVSDAKGNALTGRTVTFTSSAAGVATVSNTGVVAGVAPGTTTITATSEGRSGSLQLTVTPVPVAAVVVAPRDTVLALGNVAVLRAQTVDGSGSLLTGRTVTWTSTDPSKVTALSTGTVTAVAPGVAYVRAESEGQRDSVRVTVRSGSTPTITAIAPAMLTPGATVTITGQNFGTTLAENVVLVNGVAAPVSAASATSLTVTVPAASSLPCSATGPTPISVVVANDTATLQHPLRMATQRTLGVGQSLLLTDATTIACNEFAQTGGRYLFTVFNAETSHLIRTSFRVVGDAGTSTGNVIPAVAPSIAVAPPSLAPPRQIDRALVTETRKSIDAHRYVRELDEAFLASHKHPVRALQARRAQQGSGTLRGVQPSLVTRSLPNVGDVTTFRMRRTIGSYIDYDDVRFRAVYVGAKIIIYEDSLAPLAGTMDDTYQALGREFDDRMFGILQHFGDPLAIDSLTDGNGRIVALFSKRVNSYLSGLLGFVTSCDFFPNGGAPQNATCPSSNQGEFFYAAAPDPSSTGFARDIPTWRANMRGTLVHEAKHITSNAERFRLDADDLEDPWLEEATAQQASEIWSRMLYGRAWKGNVAWRDGPVCDYSAPGGACADNAIAIMHHFVWLYSYYEGNELRSPINNAGSDGTIYGSAWSFARWATDAYAGADEKAFLRSLVQQPSDHGVQNLTARTGQPFAQLLGRWSLATLVDDTPGFTPADPTLSLPSWNTRDIFAGMNRDLRYSDGSVAFPAAFPLRVHRYAFGRFPDTDNFVSSLPGGSFAAFEVQGAQAGSQSIGVRAPSGSVSTGKLGLAIVRVQ